MKKIYTLILMAAAVCAAQAQSVKIIKDGQVVASFAASEFDSVVFAPADAPEAGIGTLAGTYPAHLDVTLVQMPSAGLLVSEDTELKVEADGESRIILTLPGCYYAAMGQNIPSVTIPGVTVTEADGKYILYQEYTGTDEANGKSYTVTVAGEIRSDKTFDIVEQMKYGSMPFTLNMEFTPAAAK